MPQWLMRFHPHVATRGSKPLSFKYIAEEKPLVGAAASGSRGRNKLHTSIPYGINLSEE